MSIANKIRKNLSSKMEQTIQVTSGVNSAHNAGGTDEKKKKSAVDQDASGITPFSQMLNQKIEQTSSEKQMPGQNATDSDRKGTNVLPAQPDNDEKISALVKPEQMLSVTKDLVMSIKPAQESIAAILPQDAVSEEIKSKLNPLVVDEWFAKVEKTAANKNENFTDAIHKVLNPKTEPQGPVLSDKQSLGNKDAQTFLANQSAVNQTSGKISQDVLRILSGSSVAKEKEVLKDGKPLSEKHSQEMKFNTINLGNQWTERAAAKDNVNPSQLIQRVGNEIKDHVSAGGGRIKVILNPPSLGSLEMEVAVRNNKVEITLIASSRDVQQTLHTNIDHLKGTLQNQGLTVDRCDVLMQANHEDYRQHTSQQAFYRDGSDKNNGHMSDEQVLEKVTSLRPHAAGHLHASDANKISIFA